MKNLSTITFVLLLTLALSTQGFQCGSPDFSGAKLRIQQKDYPGAIKLLKSEVSKNPANEEAWFLLGEIDGEVGDIEGMDKAFDETIKISNKHEKEIFGQRYNRWGGYINNGVAFLNRGVSSDSAQFFDSAVVQLTKATQALRDTSLTFKYRGMAYLGLKDYDAAVSDFRTAWEKGKDIEAMRRISNIYFTKGMEFDSQFQDKNTDSLRILENLHKLKVGMRVEDLTTYFGAPDSRNRPEAAKKKKAPKGKESNKEQWIYKNLGLTIDLEGPQVQHFNIGRYPFIDSTSKRLAFAMFDSVAQCCELIKAQDPKDNDNLRSLMVAYERSNKLKEAIKTFETAVENDPGNKTNRYLLGVLLRENGDNEGALREFQTALKIDSTFTEAMYDAGATLFNAGVKMRNQAQEKGDESKAYLDKFKAALPYLEKASRARVDDQETFQALGNDYAVLNMGDKAKDAFAYVDWLQKHSSLKLGMKEGDLQAILGEPTKKEDTTHDSAPASKWTYDKDGVTFVVAGGVVKDWTRTGK